MGYHKYSFFNSVIGCLVFQLKVAEGDLVRVVGRLRLGDPLRLAALKGSALDGLTPRHVTRRARLACAAWFVLLAGIDEEGIDRHLDSAAELFYAAAMA